MNRKMNTALAASMLALTLAAVPQHASAALDTYLTIDGIKGESEKTTTVPSNSSWVSYIWSFFA